jgi:hypothetical protein
MPPTALAIFSAAKQAIQELMDTTLAKGASSVAAAKVREETIEGGTHLVGRVPTAAAQDLMMQKLGTWTQAAKMRDGTMLDLTGDADQDIARVMQHTGMADPASAMEHVAQPMWKLNNEYMTEDEAQWINSVFGDAKHVRTISRRLHPDEIGKPLPKKYMGGWMPDVPSERFERGRR